MNIVIGRGNLSNALIERFGVRNSVLLSSQDIVKKPSILVDLMNDIEQCSLILNCFQKSTELSTASAELLIKNSIVNLAIILNILAVYAVKINKIIYTSSSSVYGVHSNEKCIETIPASPINLHGALKFACEQLISAYCKKNAIEYSIARLFNLFGGHDDFSIISRLVNAYYSGTQFTLINKGQAIRDYMHVDDVVLAYEQLLTVTGVPILNIASGKGISTHELITWLQNHGIFLNVTYADNINEIDVSIASNALAEKHLGKRDYISVFSYLVACCKA